VFLGADVPDDQIRPADTKAFLHRLMESLAGVARTMLRPER
jgi:hypothetical protein